MNEKNAVGGQWSAVSGRQSAVGGQWSAVSGWRLAVVGQRTPKESNVYSRGIYPTIDGDSQRKFPLPMKSRFNALKSAREGTKGWVRGI
jgi:hypothetical protein